MCVHRVLLKLHFGRITLKKRGFVISIIEFITLVPNKRDHSNSDLKTKDFCLIPKTSIPLNVQLFLSLHITCNLTADYVPLPGMPCLRLKGNQRVTLLNL